MITVKEIDKSFWELYDKVAMNVDVQSEYHVKRINNGLGGLILEEVKVKLKHRTCNAVLLGL